MENPLRLTQEGAVSPRERGSRVRIGGDELAPRQARREVAALRPEVDSSVIATTELLVTELVTNSVRHAGADAIEVAVSVDPRRGRVEVANAGAPFTPRTREESEKANPGWGLFLVDELSDTWGVQGDSGRQRVWCEMSRG